MTLLRRIVAGLLALAVLVLLVGWLMLRASLPDLDGNVTTAGVDAAATIERDAAGIPVITAANRKDLAFATGFAHGQDRFFQMDLARRMAAGELAELLGRTTGGLRYSFTYPRDQQTRALKACGRKIGRRVYYPASEVARIIIGTGEA